MRATRAMRDLRDIQRTPAFLFALASVALACGGGGGSPATPTDGGGADGAGSSSGASSGGASSGGAGTDAEAAADGGASSSGGSGSGGSSGGSGGNPDASAPPHDGGASGGDSGSGAGDLQTHTYEGRQVLVYVPRSYAKGTAAPLVLMLHGCTQTPADFAAGTQMNAQADKAGFLVAYPAEPSSANAQECWNWFLAADQARNAGEPQLLARIVGDVSADFTVDAKRVFTAGISAGAAMSVILGATYPDLFAAIAVHSGLEYAAATDASSGLTASASGGPNPSTQGDLAFTAMGAQARPVPVLVFHGDADPVVNVTNGSQVVAQWSETDARAAASVGPAVMSSGSAGGKTFTHTTYADGSSSKSLLELYVVHGLAHAWSGGSSAGSYTDPAGPDATSLTWQFFANHGR